jgi:hypothetical protein
MRLCDRRLYVVDRRADHGPPDCLIGGVIKSSEDQSQVTGLSAIVETV